MCGIAGVFNWDPERPVPAEPLRQAAERMQLRGPDAGGFYEGRGVSFAHRRLAVIDLSGGQQPLTDPQTGVTLTYNGEIYNYRILREELTMRGHRFVSQCDTEVLLHAYLEWGTYCLEHLRGIFAFGIYDPRSEELFLARDRMGTKPLYYAQTSTGVIFASSVAAMLAFPEIDRQQVDGAALMHYLMTIRTTLESRTLFEQVRTLEPGTFCKVVRASKCSSVRRYWEFPIVPEVEKESFSEETAAAEIQQMVCEAVDEQMVSDVPLGGFLSGGIDSTVIASVAAACGRFGAYSVGYAEHDCHEWPYVRMAAKQFGVHCREVHLDLSDYVETWQFLLQQKGLPLSTPNEVPIYRLARALKEDYTVALSGEGADELFGGYVIPYFSCFDYERARKDGSGRIGRAMMRLYGQNGFADHAEHHFLLNSWIAPALRSRLLTDSMERYAPAVTDVYRRQFSRFDGCSTLDKQMHVHARVNLEGLLNRVDTSTMAASVEARVPFTDHRMAEYLFRMPDRFKLDWVDETARMRGRIMNAAEIDRHQLVESKRLLRRAFRGTVPDEIMTRRKVSFAVPFREWLGGPLRPLAAEWISQSELIAQIIRPEALKELLEGPGGQLTGMVLWPLANLALWEKSCAQ